MACTEVDVFGMQWRQAWHSLLSWLMQSTAILQVEQCSMQQLFGMPAFCTGDMPPRPMFFGVYSIESTFGIQHDGEYTIMLCCTGPQFNQSIICNVQLHALGTCLAREFPAPTGTRPFDWLLTFANLRVGGLLSAAKSVPVSPA